MNINQLVQEKENIMSSKYYVPFYSSEAMHKEIKKEILVNIEKVYDSDIYIDGCYLNKFEQNFSNYLGAKYCVACNSGTDALILILVALGIGPGDEVVVPTNTFIATANAVVLCGATPVFVEPSILDYNINCSKIENVITDRTKAIIAVHMYGRPANLKELIKLKEKYNLFLIEDVAQAHGAKYRNVKVGTYGVASAFSFYPRKNLGALGDGGAVVTDDCKIAERVRSIARYGQKKRYYCSYIGFNSRLDEMQAAILNVKLKYLDEKIKERRLIANYYLENIDNDLVKLPLSDDGIISQSWYIFCMRVDKRDDFIKWMEYNHIEVMVHYPLSIVEQVAYVSILGADGISCSTQLHNEIVSLPLWPGMKKWQYEHVVETINKWRG